MIPFLYQDTYHDVSLMLPNTGPPWRPHRPESGDKVRRQSIRHLRSSDVEQSANDSQKL